MKPTNRPPRPVRTLTVVRTEQLSPTMVRVILTGDDIAKVPDLTFTDHYVKLKFGDVTRTYTIRWLDKAAQELAMDFVIHGDEGLAGPWAAAAKPGDELSFVGPGGAWAPRPDAAVHLFVGDDSALPAIAAGLEALPRDAKALVFLEVPTAADEQPLPVTDQTELHWVHRDAHGTGYGEALTYVVQSADLPRDNVEVFLHGNADMVKPLRHLIYNELRIPREHTSLSGYWRTGMNEDGWQSSKREFVAALEAEQDG